MKRIKKLVSIMLCLLLVVSMFAACGKKDDTPTDTTPATEDTDKEPVATEAPADSTAPAATEAPAVAAGPIASVPTDATFDLSLGIWPDPTLTNEITLHEGYVETFKADHPNVNVVPAFYFYAVDTFVPLAESGGLATVFHTWYTDTQKIINGGYVADITDILAERGWLDTMNPSIKDLMSKDGRTYGLPRDGYALGLMINVALFKQAGIVDADGLPIYPQTWAELAETAKKIKDATGAAGLCLLAADNAGGWHFSNIAWNFGATLCTADAEGKFTSNLDSPEAIEAMEYVKSLKWEYDVLTADPTVENWGTGFTQLGTGAAAMYIGANDAVNNPTYTNGLPVEDFGLAPLPAGPRGDQYSLSGGTPYMFSKDATKEQINAALDYIAIMGRGPVVDEKALRADAQYQVDSGIPVIYRFPCWIDQSVIDTEKAIKDEYSNVDMRLYNAYFDTVKKPGNLRMEEPGNTQEMYRELTSVLQAVITDKNADVAALMKTADENYQAILDSTVNAD